MKLRLTDTNVRALKAKDKTLEARDTVVPALVLRVGKKGVKVWEVVLNTGKSRRRKRLGIFPIMNVKDARKAAEGEKLASQNPMADIRLKTTADLFEEYKLDRQNSLRSWKDIENVWDLWAADRIGHIRLSDLTVHHGNDLRNHVTRKSTPNRAASVIRNIRPMFAWAIKNSLMSENPWRDLNTGVTTEQRDRVLSPREWEALWSASFTETYPLGTFTRALMLTAQRLSTVAGMRWQDIDFEQRLWTIPREKMKGSRAQEVPMSAKLVDLLGNVPRQGPYVFTTRGDRPIAAGSKLKKRLDAQLGFEDWRFHDVRRTAATMMTTGGVSRFIVERTLAHVDGSVTAIYDRSAYREEKLHALEVLAATVGNA